MNCLSSWGVASRLVALVTCACGVVLCTTTPAAAQESPALFNVSTRGNVGTGSDVLIAGLVIQGSAPRTILFRVLGPTLASFDVPGSLADPTVALYSGQTEIASNDDWESDAGSANTARDAGLAPPSARECIIVRTLAPGAYTAMVKGKNSTTGIALVEAYDLDTRASTAPSLSRVLNLSTRGRVGTGYSVMITGFIINGTEPRTVLINAIGGSLAEFGLSGVLGDPSLEIYNSSGQKIAESDDWLDSADFETIAKTGFSPRDPLEPSLWLTLQPGAYTAMVKGVNNAEGTALPELYEVRTLNNDVRFSPTSIGDRTGKLAYSTGSAAESIDLTFTGGAVASVNGGANGTYTYVAGDNFRGTLKVQASGYTLDGKLTFYRNKIAVFEGKLQKPGSANQDAGGVLVLN